MQIQAGQGLPPERCMRRYQGGYPKAHQFKLLQRNYGIQEIEEEEEKEECSGT